VSYRHIRNERGFFSDYYLGSVFGRGAGRGRRKGLSDKATELAASRFRRLYERTVGKSLSPSECRERVVRPLLREVFGFLLGDGEDRIFPLRPVDAEAAPIALAWIGGSDDDLGSGRGKSSSPRRQLEAALSRHGLRYGLLVTGERLRLVRAAGEGPQGAFLEIDLAGLAEDPDPESFALALKLLGAANFVPGASGELPLEEYERESRKHAEKVSEDLKEAVFRAAESLVIGLLADAVDRGTVEDPARLSSDELGRFRDAALLALYRLLFILYAEARDPRLDDNKIYHQSYSANGLVGDLLADLLRPWPENRSSLWARCLALFEIYDRGLPPIVHPWENIPPRGGDLFRCDTPEGAILAEARLSDAAVGRLVLDLATTTPRQGVGRERISFRELDIEDLGAVYEGLLEFEPRVAAGPTLEIRVQGRLFFLSPEEAARLCETRSLSLRGPIEWVAGTPAERFHPEGEAEDEEEQLEEELEDAEEAESDEEEEDDTGEGSPDAEKGLKKGGVARLNRRFERGAFHFAPGPGRKGSGSFYTPRLLVQDLVRYALGPVAVGKSVAEIEALRVLDPACGSGHFLVEAMRFLGAELHRAYVREHGGKAPPAFRSTTGKGWDADCEASDAEARAAASEARAWCKRRIAERCLFGVDLNPTAVTLAHVALWIESAAGDRPLTYFKHHVGWGNSLLGSWLERLDAPPVTQKDARQKDVFAEKLRQDFHQAVQGLDAQLAEAQKLRLLIDHAAPEDLAREGIDPESLEEQSYKERLNREAEDALAGARLLFDLRSASLFVPEIWRDGRSLAHLITSPKELEAAARPHAWWAPFADLRSRYRFFHWELEFPEIFLSRERPGFDAVLGNPPWDKVLPERLTFYARADPLIRAFKGSELDQRIREIHTAHPGLQERFDVFQQETKQAAQFLRSSGDFPYAQARSQAAHEDLSKYLLDRAARLTAEGGAVGFLVPSVVYNGDGCVGLRRYLLTETRIERFYAFENRRKLFPIDSRYKFVNLVFRKGVAHEPFTAAFMRCDPEELTAPGEKPWLVGLSREEIERYSPETLAFLEYRGPRDQKNVAKMHAGRPMLGSGPEVQGSWGVTLFTDFAHLLTYNATRDKDLWTDPKTGKLFTPASVLGFEPEDFDETLERMRAAGFWPVFEGKHIDQFLVGIKPIRWWLSVEAAERKYGKRPREEATLVFRETARNTDERTSIAVVLPAKSAGAHTLSGGIFETVAAEVAASVMNSICFDYALRLRTAGTHISFTYLLPMPVPQAGIARTLPSIPTYLAPIDRLAHVSEDQRLWPRLWDLNRSVAEAYGLDAADFEHILGTFPGMAKKRKAFFAYLEGRLEDWKNGL
jgi:Eco57I restriction-modification methylase